MIIKEISLTSIFSSNIDARKPWDRLLNQRISYCVHSIIYKLMPAPYLLSHSACLSYCGMILSNSFQNALLWLGWMRCTNSCATMKWITSMGAMAHFQWKLTLPNAEQEPHLFCNSWILISLGDTSRRLAYISTAGFIFWLSCFLYQFLNRMPYNEERFKALMLREI